MRSTLKENHELRDLKADMPCEEEEGRGFPREVMLQLMVREVRYNHRDKEEGKSFRAERKETERECTTREGTWHV